jgi:hypothetical protein
VILQRWIAEWGWQHTGMSKESEGNKVLIFLAAFLYGYLHRKHQQEDMENAFRRAMSPRENA